MTREEKIEAFAMRLDGKTYEAIGERFGVSKQYIERILNTSTMKGASPLKKIIYPNLGQYIKTHYNGVLNFCRALGYESKNVTPMYKKLRGKSAMTISEVRNILNLTGMTFGECFALADGATEFVDARKKIEKRKREDANE